MTATLPYMSIFATTLISLSSRASVDHIFRILVFDVKLVFDDLPGQDAIDHIVSGKILISHFIGRMISESNSPCPRGFPHLPQDFVIHGPVVSPEIIDGKVWLQADNNDLRIAERLRRGRHPKRRYRAKLPTAERPAVHRIRRGLTTPVNCRERGTDKNRRTTFISEIAVSLPDQGSVDCLQIVERDHAINREFEQSRAAARNQKPKQVSLQSRSRAAFSELSTPRRDSRRSAKGGPPAITGRSWVGYIQSILRPKTMPSLPTAMSLPFVAVKLRK